jgi:hypothetical protein
LVILLLFCILWAKGANLTVSRVIQRVRRNPIMALIDTRETDRPVIERGVDTLYHKILYLVLALFILGILRKDFSSLIGFGILIFPTMGFTETFLLRIICLLYLNFSRIDTSFDSSLDSTKRPSASVQKRLTHTGALKNSEVLSGLPVADANTIAFAIMNDRIERKLRVRVLYHQRLSYLALGLKPIFHLAAPIGLSIVLTNETTTILIFKTVLYVPLVSSTRPRRKWLLLMRSRNRGLSLSSHNTISSLSLSLSYLVFAGGSLKVWTSKAPATFLRPHTTTRGGGCLMAENQKS